MSIHKIYSALICIVLFVIPGLSHATFIDRGNGLIYDTWLDVTWLQDANYAMTTGYDSDGLMDWDSATTWAADLSVNGYDGWRLPTINTSNPRPGMGDTPDTGNEFGWLWYQLGGGGTLSTSDDFLPFTNVPFASGLSEYYWTGVQYDSTEAWNFLIDCACWGHGDMNVEHYAWAVHSGDIAQVPEPGSLLLLASGLAGFGLFRRRKQ